MDTGTNLVASLQSWSIAEEGLSFNTNLLDTNLINLVVVIGVLVYFGKGVCAG
jgi:F-type H+-transporting ATPase subunit b